MRTVNYTEVRQNLASVLDSVIDDAEEVIVTRSGHEDVVIVSLAEWNSIKETEYLRRSPVNAERLDRAVAELERGAAVIVTPEQLEERLARLSDQGAA